ncbi:hypothetical protein Pla108_37350 [Botrimarina colliarenosi]|uniref:DUF1570 domain-containing protein n=1 Tax=Botrimarina colliarenosi TaxID=2528001 RepID=A0A5C6A2D1_9BACT|nr:hypothetical protein [Botrimarina colliarenosi]TWT94024.1 hypothetical protein Pla108_37350 [Botrimarina colliarenosi]
MPGRRSAGPITRRQALAAGLAAGASLLAGRSSLAAAEPVWVDQRQLGPFICRSAFRLDDRLLAEADLSRLEQELRRVLALGPCQTQVEVLLLGDAQQHRALIAERHPDAPYRRALYYQTQRRAVIYAYRHRELAIDLRHECTHALLHGDLAMVPLWLDEGLAEYFEPSTNERARGPGHLDAVVADAARGRLLTLASLESKHDLAQMTEVDYRYAWAWTHLLLHGPPIAAMQLWATLASLRRLEPPAAVSERLAATLGSPEQAFLQHFRAWPGVLNASRRGASNRR